MFTDYATSPIDVLDKSDQWLCTYRYEPFLRKWFYIEPSMHGEVMLVERDDVPSELVSQAEMVKYETKKEDSYYAPLKLQVQLNRSCNFSCKMCYVPDKERAANLSIESLNTLFAECKEAGVVRVNFVGGEIFMRKDVEDVVELARHQCLLVSCITNGIIPGSNIEKYRRVLDKMFAVQVSCNGVGESYNREHQMNIWEKASRCIENVIRSTKANILSYVITNDNYKDISEFVAYADYIGANVIKFGTVCWSGKSAQNGSEFYYRETLSAAKEIISKCRTDYPSIKIQSQLDSEIDSPMWEEFINGYRPYEFYFSPEARDGLYLSALGDFYPFPLLSDHESFRVGRIGDSLICIWNESSVLNSIRAVKFSDTKCGQLGCPGVCGLWNRSYAIAWSNDLYGKVPCFYDAQYHRKEVTHEKENSEGCNS